MNDLNPNLPWQLDSNYLKRQYMFTIVELESLFADLRNADDEGRLEIVEHMLSQADAWLDEAYESIGVTPEQRAEADQLQLKLMEQLSNLGINPGDFDLLDPDEREL